MENKQPEFEKGRNHLQPLRPALAHVLREADYPTGAGSIRVALSTVSRPPGRHSRAAHPGVRSPTLRDRGRLIETPCQHEGDRSDSEVCAVFSRRFPVSSGE